MIQITQKSDIRTYDDSAVFQGPHIYSPSQFEQLHDFEHFEPHFQPQVTLQSGRLAGFEILARWNHPKLGIVHPDMFIPLAERDGWIAPLTRRLLRKALPVLRILPDPLSLSINVSPVQLRDASLPRLIGDVAEETGCPLDRLTIEITETALLENLQQVRSITSELKAMGCMISLDDFGTGYSSLRHVQSLAFDELKVDASFVRSMTEQRCSRKIVAAVVGLGQSLGIRTVAEGVETQEQADILRWLGCDIGQGWLFGRPAPADTLDETIAADEQNAKTSQRFHWKSPPMASLEGLPGQRLAQLQAVHDGAPVGLGFLDRNLRYVNINGRLAEMHGATAEDHVGKTFREMVPAFADQVEPLLRRALMGESVSDVEVSVPCATSGCRAFLVSYQPALDEAGEIVGVSCAVLDYTSRKVAEERLRQFERVVESLDEMIVVLDRDYRYLLANQSFLKYRGMEPEQVIGRLPADVLGQKGFELVKHQLDECLSGKPVKFGIQYRYPVLGERDLEISYSPIESSGRVTAVACVLRDVTDWNRLQRREQDWRTRVELAQQSGLRMGMWDWDMDANCIIASDESYRQWGFTRENFSGRIEEVIGRVHADDRARTAETIARALRGELTDFAAECRAQRPDGSVCWIDLHGVVLREDRRHMVGVGVDMTTLKQAQQSLRESEEKYLLLLNSTAEAIYGIDLEGKCTFCNPACLRALGYERQQDLLGKSMHQLVHHTYSDGRPYPEHKCKIYTAIREGRGSHEMEDILWRADGTWFPVEHWSYPMHAQGKLVGAVVTFFDLSAGGARCHDSAGTGSDCVQLHCNKH